MTLSLTELYEILSIVDSWSLEGYAFRGWKNDSEHDTAIAVCSRRILKQRELSGYVEPESEDGPECECSACGCLMSNTEEHFCSADEDYPSIDDELEYPIHNRHTCTNCGNHVDDCDCEENDLDIPTLQEMYDNDHEFNKDEEEFNC